METAGVACSILTVSGYFAREWSDIQARGLEHLEQLRAEARNSPLAQAEKRLVHDSGSSREN
jgi:ketol-acid reductoisomerase